MVFIKSLILSKLLREIERIFDRGKGSGWSNNDFEKLCETILEVTGKRLSISTLKRIWGRTTSTPGPSLTTLNILSEYAGYENWRTFCRSNRAGTIAFKKSANSRRNKVLINGISLLGVVLLISGLLFFNSAKKVPAERSKDLSAIILDSIKFSFDKVTTGYPNTVIFRYDIGTLEYDSLTIQQSWDESKRILLSGPNGLVTGTYYYPGYFLAKLIVNDRIVKEKGLYIPTDGWQGIILNGDDFSYLDPKEIETGGTLRLGPNTLSQLNAHPNTQLYLANLSSHPELESSGFNLETEFRLSQPTEQSICRFVRMTVTGSKEVLSFQFGIPGCVGDLLFALNKKMISGRENDLSGFGLEPARWASCSIRYKNNRLLVYVNGKIALEEQLASDIGKIGGVQWIFEGSGEIRKLIIKDGERQLDLVPQ